MLEKFEAVPQSNPASPTDFGDPKLAQERGATLRRIIDGFKSIPDKDIPGFEHLPSEIRERLREIAVSRVVKTDTRTGMFSFDIPGYIKPHGIYTLGDNGLLPADSSTQDQNEEVTPPSTEEIPHTTITNTNWNPDGTIDKKGANIFGAMGTLTIDTDKLEIEESEPTPSNLAYYGAQLICPGDSIKFETEHSLPLVTTYVGERYATEFQAIKEHGGGSQLEYHDAPHFHFPLSNSCSGHLILGRIEENSDITLSAFKIPYPNAIYMSPGTIHNDGFLTGLYQVGYSIEGEASTVVLQNLEGKGVNLKIDTIN